MKLKLISFYTELKDYMSEAVHTAFRVVALKKLLMWHMTCKLKVLSLILFYKIYFVPTIVLYHFA